MDSITVGKIFAKQHFVNKLGILADEKTILLVTKVFPKITANGSRKLVMATVINVD